MKYFCLVLVLFVLMKPVGFHSTKADASSVEALIQSFSEVSATSHSEVRSIFKDRLRVDGKKLSVSPKSSKVIDRLTDHFMELCKKHVLDPALVLALIQVESSFRSDVTSVAGAQGLLQVMPATARVVARSIGFKKRVDLKDPFTNLTLGVSYLSFLKKKYKEHSPYYMLAAYNLGPARLDELMTRKGGFKPDQTKRYFEDVKQNLFELRNRKKNVRTQS